MDGDVMKTYEHILISGNVASVIIEISRQLSDLESASHVEARVAFTHAESEKHIAIAQAFSDARRIAYQVAHERIKEQESEAYSTDTMSTDRAAG